jgi:hypothetical protein
MGTQDDPKPRRPDDDEPEPDFARGLAETDPHKHGRFSTGEEQVPEPDDKDVEEGDPAGE